MDIDHLIVASAKAASDAFLSMSLSQAKPTGVTLDISTVEQAAEKLNSGRLDHKKVIVVPGNIGETLAFATRVPGISTINDGGIARKEGARQFAKAIWLTAQEIADSRALKEKGILLEMRQAPAHSGELLTINSESGGHYVAYRDVTRTACRSGHPRRTPAGGVDN